MIFSGSNLFVLSLDNVGSIMSVWELINDSFSIASSTGLWILAKDDSEDGQFSFVGINSVAAESFTLSKERWTELMAGDGTSNFKESILFVWTSDEKGSVLTVWELINVSLSIDSSTELWIWGRDNDEEGRFSFVYQSLTKIGRDW